MIFNEKIPKFHKKYAKIPKFPKIRKQKEYLSNINTRNYDSSKNDEKNTMLYGKSKTLIHSPHFFKIEIVNIQYVGYPYKLETFPYNKKGLIPITEISPKQVVNV